MGAMPLLPEFWPYQSPVIQATAQQPGTAGQTRKLAFAAQPMWVSTALHITTMQHAHALLTSSIQPVAYVPGRTNCASSLECTASEPIDVSLIPIEAYELPEQLRWPAQLGCVGDVWKSLHTALVVLVVVTSMPRGPASSLRNRHHEKKALHNLTAESRRNSKKRTNRSTTAELNPLMRIARGLRR